MPAASKIASRFDDLPLFPSDEELAKAIWGPRARASDFTRIATLNESRNFPKIDALWGGRYKYAVKAFFDREYGLTASPLLAPGGSERPEAWKTPSNTTRKAG